MKWFVRIASIIACAFDVAAADPLPVVNVYANESTIGEGTLTYRGFSIVNSSVSPVVVRFEFTGTAKLNIDYRLADWPQTNSPFAVTNSANISVSALRDAEIEPDESIVLRLLPDPSYQIGDASLASIRIRSAPPPTVTLDLNSQTTTELVAGNPFTFGGWVSQNVTSIWVYIDDSLLTRINRTSASGVFSATWTNPPPDVHVITVEVKDIYGMSARVSNNVRVLDGLAKPAAIGGTADGATITSTSSTLFDKTGRSAVFVEFAIPASATNYDALLSEDYWVPAHQLFAYEGDGVVNANDLSANEEFIGTFGGFGLRPRFEIGSLVRRYAGRHLGLKLQFDPRVPYSSVEGSQAGFFGFLRILLFAPDTDVPGTIRWTNFPENTPQFSDEPMRIDLEIFDGDTQIKAVEIRAASFTNAPLILRQQVDLPPGTNHLTLWWTNDWPGIKTFSLRMEPQDEVGTNIVGNITFYPTRGGGPVHRWLGLDGEAPSFYLVDAAGRAWVWGRNQNGQLGLGFTNASVTRPLSLAAPGGKKWRHFTSNSGCGRSMDGTP